jgi:hypothetical protein
MLLYEGSRSLASGRLPAWPELSQGADARVGQGADHAMTMSCSYEYRKLRYEILDTENRVRGQHFTFCTE